MPTARELKDLYKNVIVRNASSLFKLTEPESSAAAMGARVVRDSNLFYIYSGISLRENKNFVKDITTVFQSSKQANEVRAGWGGWARTRRRRGLFASSSSPLLLNLGSRLFEQEGWGLRQQAESPGSEAVPEKEVTGIESLDVGHEAIKSWHDFIERTFGVSAKPVISKSFEDLLALGDRIGGLELTSGLYAGGLTLLLPDPSNNAFRNKIPEAVQFITNKEWGIYPIAIYTSPIIYSFEDLIEKAISAALKMKGEPSEDDKRFLVEIYSGSKELAQKVRKEALDEGLPFARQTGIIVYYSFDKLLREYLEAISEQTGDNKAKEQLIKEIKSLFQKAKTEVSSSAVLQRLKACESKSKLDVLTVA